MSSDLAMTSVIENTASDTVGQVLITTMSTVILAHGYGLEKDISR